MDVKDISRMLAAQVSSLVPQLLPGAKREGHEWRVGSIAGERGRSLSINASGPRAGVWSDFSSNDLKGDMLDLVAAVMFAGDKGKAVAWAKSYLGIDNMDPARLKTVRAEIKRKAEVSDAEALRETEQKKKVAKAIWLAGTPSLIGTAADHYLFGRGIDVRHLSREPGALRFHPSLDYPPGMNDARRESYPAMVAAVINADGDHICTHRTFLKDYGLALVKKAPVRDAKLCLGSYRGGSIPIARGASNQPFKQAPEGDTIILTEGIEDALTLALVMPDFRVHAAISVSNFQNVWLPPTITNVILAVDNDPETITVGNTTKPHPARVAVQAAIDAFIDQGRDVRVAYSPAGKDFNEALRAGNVQSQKDAG